MLAVRCGLLAKWLRVKVRVRVRAWARECTSCAFFFPYSISIDDVTATWIEVNLVFPV